MQNSEPVFLVGAERSGTTLLRIMLDHHPRIAFLAEFEFIVDWVEDDGGFPPASTFAKCLRDDRVFLGHQLEIDAGLGYAELVADFLEQGRARAGKERVGATVHRHFDRLLHIWPQARFIHLLRDGRDVSRSCIQMGWAGNVWTGVRRWEESEQLWERFSARCPQENRIDITFEDLVENPERELDRACRLMDLEYDPKMLTYPEDSTYGPVDASMARKWPFSMSEDEVRLVESRVGGLLERRGYELSSLPRCNPGFLLRLRLKIQDRWYQHHFRIQKFGWRLYLSEMVSRRLGLSRWNRRLQPEIHAIQNARLR